MSWKKIILYGDSLTQYSFSIKGWGAAIADQYQRKFDVYNRGFSGYTSGDGLNIFDEVLSKEFCKDIDCMTVWFGANDASSGIQHVPLETYSQNLKKIFRKMEDCGIDKSKIILIGPPRVHEEKRLKYKQETDGPDAVITRADKIAWAYAEACEKIGLEFGCKTLNIWKEMEKEKDWGNLLNDGLHFSEVGNQFVARLILPLLEDIVGEVEDNFPPWREFHPEENTA